MIATTVKSQELRTSGHSSGMHSSVLALNRFFIAVHVVPVRRAFCLLWKQMAEVISVENGAFMAYDFRSWLEISELKTALNERCDVEDWVRAVNFEIQVPRVIRLLDYDRVPRNVVKFNRRNIFLRDGNRCQYCGKQFGAHSLSLDHVMPRSRGGQTTWENIVCACLKCNVRKGGRTPQEAGMTLFRMPSRPKRSPVLSQQLTHHKYACWRTFLD
jgi:5-methylcytosine-specific restriction endonuclease McrA